MASQDTTARGLHIHAVAFSAAAEAVHSSKLADPFPEYFLWGRTVELVLKSFLLTKGQTVAELKREFGHDLNSLLRDANLRGISKLIGLNAIDIGIIKVLNLDYLSKRFEYREIGATYHLPDVTMTRRFVKRLLRGIDFHLKNYKGKTRG